MSQCWCWYLPVCAWKLMVTFQVNSLTIVWMGTMCAIPGACLYWGVQMHCYEWRYRRCLDPVDWSISKCSFSCIRMLLLWFSKKNWTTLIYMGQLYAILPIPLIGYFWTVICVELQLENIPDYTWINFFLLFPWSRYQLPVSLILTPQL